MSIRNAIKDQQRQAEKERRRAEAIADAHDSRVRGSLSEVTGLFAEYTGQSQDRWNVRRRWTGRTVTWEICEGNDNIVLCVDLYGLNDDGFILVDYFDGSLSFREVSGLSDGTLSYFIAHRLREAWKFTGIPPSHVREH